MGSNLIKRIIKKAENIPPMPGVAAKVLEITNENDFSLERLTKIISLDPVITAMVLKAANSSFFGTKQNATSLQAAIPLLGAEKVAEIALSLAVSPTLAGNLAGYQLSDGQLWRHGMASALISSWLCRKFAWDDAPTIFTAALCHDVGKLVLSEFVGEKIKDIRVLVDEERLGLCIAEKKVLGVDHPSIGAKIARRWKLGPQIEEAIQYHHEPEKAPKPRHATNVVVLSNYLTVTAGETGGVGEEHVDAPKLSLWELEVYPKELSEMVKSAESLFKKAEPVLSMAG